MNSPASPQLQISKSHSGSFTQGGDGAYTIPVTNTGVAATAGGVTVTDTLPSGLAATAASGNGWSCSVALSTFSCYRADSAEPNASFPSLTIQVHVLANAPAQIVNTATVSWGGQSAPSQSAATDPTQIIPAALPQLTIQKTADRSTAVVGDTVTYTINIQNTSSVPLANAQLHDRLPSSFRYVNGSAHIDGVAASSISSNSGFSVQGNGPDLLMQINAIKPHAQISLLYRARVGADAQSGNLTNTVTLTGSAPSGQPVTPLTAQAVVKVGPNLLTIQRPLIGRVYVDENGNNTFDRDDVPVAGVRVFLNDGQSATTDSAGFYSLPFVGQGSVVVALEQP